MRWHLAAGAQVELEKHEMAGSCLRVDPSFVKFKDVKVGEVYRKAFKVTNVGKTLKKIIIEKPTLKVTLFQVFSTISLHRVKE